MKTLTTLFAVVALCCFTGLTNAQEKMEATGKECVNGSCPIAKAMGELPQMTFKVGEEATCCSESAAKLAKEHSKPIHFVVGKAIFENKEKAFVSLVEQTEKFVDGYLSPCKCEVSGATKIAGKSCNCPVEAGKTAELVKAAAEKVTMSYSVGEKTCDCPNEATAIAKTTGAKKEYVVGGEKTCCEMTARLNLARAKYKAAVEALAATTAKQASTEKDG